MKKINGYIRNYEEAILVMQAARIGILTPATERLNNEERERIESGNIFCFIEDPNGMKRWTDGRIWSPSKINGEFLVYQEVPRHMSKNSIKKRKEFEKSMEVEEVSVRSIGRDEQLDRTTLHKKTVCIKHDNLNYHIVAYYRPIFLNYSILDIDFFKRLADALVSFPQLNENAYLKVEIEKKDFFQRHNLISEVYPPELGMDKRNALEGIAAEVLKSFCRISQRETR